jgi:hypothetical protein
VVPVDIRPSERIGGVIESVPRAVYGVFRTRLNLEFPDLPTLTVRLLADRPAYDRLVGPDAARSDPNGVFSPAANEIVTWYRPSSDAMVQCLAGETGRALLRKRAPFAPPWLREGLARYFALLRVLGNTTAVFPDPRLDREAQALLDAGKLLPTARLLTLSDPEWQRENQTDQRAQVQSWSLVYFLLSTPEGGRFIGDLLRRAAPDDDDPQSAVDIGPQGPWGAEGVGGLDSRWRSWLSSHKPAHYY